MVEKFHETKNCNLVRRAWRTKYKSKTAPDIKTIKRAVSKFSNLGLVSNLHPGPAPDLVKREQVKIQLKALVADNSNFSLRKAAPAVGVSTTTVRKILIDELHLYPYKYQTSQALKHTDYAKRVNFAEWFLSRPTNITQYFIASDEAYFYLTEALNKQNNRVWSESRPYNRIEVPLHPLNIHVWCAISAKRIFGPFYFEENVKAANYLEMLKTFFWPKVLRTVEYKKYYFQQDGAAAHKSNIVQEWCGQRFGEKFMPKEMWPPRSPDLNPCDYFLWGYLKSVAYNPYPKTIDDLKRNIEREIKKITPEMLKNVFSNLEKRCKLVISKDGKHFESK